MGDAVSEATTPLATQRAPTDERVAILHALRPLVAGIVQTFGEGCEAVLHDFNDPEHSIIEIAGSVTGRRVGGSVTQIGLSLIAQNDSARDQIGYITRTQTGRILKSSTLLLRDRAGRVFGAFCINFDVTDLRAAAQHLSQIAGSVLTPPNDVYFTDDMATVLQAVVRQEEQALGRGIDKSNRQDRLLIVDALRRRGLFAVQRAVPFVAEYLGVSRASIYAYLDESTRAGRSNDSRSPRKAVGA